MNSLPVCLLFGVISKPKKKKALQTFPLDHESFADEILKQRTFEEYYKVVLSPEKRIFLNNADRMILIEEINKVVYNFVCTKKRNDTESQIHDQELRQLVLETIDLYYNHLPQTYKFSQTISYSTLSNPSPNHLDSQNSYVYFSLYINDFIEVKNSSKYRAILNSQAFPFPITLDKVDIFDPRVIIAANQTWYPMQRKLHNFLPSLGSKIENSFPWVNEFLFVNLANIYGRIHEDNLSYLAPNYINGHLDELETLVQKYSSYSSDFDSFKDKLNQHRKKQHLSVSLANVFSTHKNPCQDILNYSLINMDALPFDKAAFPHFKENIKLSNTIPTQTSSFPYASILPKTIRDFYQSLLPNALDATLIQSNEPSIHSMLSRNHKKRLRYAHLLAASDQENIKLSNPLRSVNIETKESDHYRNMKIIQHRDPNSSNLLPFIGDGTLSTMKGVSELFGAHIPNQHNLKRPRDESIAPRPEDIHDYNVKTEEDAPSPELLCLIKDIMAYKLALATNNTITSKISNANKLLFDQAFDETALIALAVIVEELISAQMEYWRSQGTFLPFSTQTLRSEFFAQVSGAQSQIPFSKSINSYIQSILEGLFDRDLSSFSHHFEEWLNEMPTSQSSQIIIDKSLPKDPEWTLNRVSVSTLPQTKRLRPSSHLPQYLQDAKEEYNFMVSPLYMDLDEVTSPSDIIT